VKRALLVGLLALALAVPGVAAPRITVFAASSLTDVFPALDSSPRYSFAGSDQLAFQIRQRAPADVFAAASPKQPEALYREGLVSKPVVFTTNRLVLVVPRANPARIRSVFDLRRPGIKLVVGAPGVPVGDYTRKALAKLGLTAVLDHVVSEEPDVRGVVAKVALGEADAGFVYATDARSVVRKVRTIALPARAQPVVRYEVAVVRASRHAAAARAFVARVLGPSGRATLRRFGFGPP
jgi:molybdate transport system substrate-binding protein